MNNNKTADTWPSGQWSGFWTEPRRKFTPFKNCMDLDLRFEEGQVTGSGCDSVDFFTIQGSYNSETGRCTFAKRYTTHSVDYDGRRDGKGIYGGWSISDLLGGTGGFHIWPGGLGEGAFAHLKAAVGIPEVAKKKARPVPAERPPVPKEDNR